MSNIQHAVSRTDEGQTFVTAFVNGKLLPPIDNGHPNFDTILDLLTDAAKGVEVDADHLVSLFDVEQTIREQFARLSDRVTVRNGQVYLDGDPVHGTLQEQIIDFLNAGEEFAPLVKFYEKLLTNPLGDVREGLYDWIKGQRANGNLTITPEGNVLGYKSVTAAEPEWRTDHETVFVPSRRGEGIVNGREVGLGEFIEQVVGDTVEMPRSRVLNAPSVACGDGLHIGTYQYAKAFTGDTVMLVEFDPRDIVSLPDLNSTWKLRVCRYKVVDVVSEPLEIPVWSPQGTDEPVRTSGGDFAPGDRVIDPSGYVGTVEHGEDEDGDVLVRWDADDTEEYVFASDLARIDAAEEEEAEEEDGLDVDISLRNDKGQFHQGRPGSTRCPHTGRFI